MLLRIIATVLITALIMVLLFLIVMLYDGWCKKDDETRELRKENNKMRDQLNRIDMANRKREKQECYERGLYDGRRTDALYRNLLKRMSPSEQQTAIMPDEGGEKA